MFRFLELEKHDIILLQETMSCGKDIIDELSKGLKGWDFDFVDSIWLSRGIVTKWNNNMVLTDSFGIFSSLCIEFCSKSLG